MDEEHPRRRLEDRPDIIALFGGLLGIAIGVPFGLAAVTSIPWEMETSIPMRSLAIYLFVAGIFGILAAILPAYRASRLNVLEAISHQ